MMLKSFLILPFLLAVTATNSGTLHAFYNAKIIDLDSDGTGIADNDIRSFKVNVETSFHNESHPFHYQFYKCGEMIFNGSTDMSSNNTLFFYNEWVTLFLNGSNGTCGEGSRKLIVISDVEYGTVTFTFEKSTIQRAEPISAFETKYIMLLSDTPTYQRIDGQLELNETPESGFTVFISSENAMKFDFVRCNSTFVTFDEQSAFDRTFTEHENNLISLMRNVECVDNSGYKSPYFQVRYHAVTNETAYLIIESKLNEQLKLSENFEGLRELNN